MVDKIHTMVDKIHTMVDKIHTMVDKILHRKLNIKEQEFH